MTNSHFAHQRLHHQHLASAAFEHPGDVVRWFGALQAQDYPGALWAIGLRMQNAHEAGIEQLLADNVQRLTIWTPAHYQTNTVVGRKDLQTA